MSITSQEIKVSGEIYLCQGVDFASVYTLFFIEFATVPIVLVWYLFYIKF
jgi:hypothetical protein